jgi:3-deoxy-manno-octulosonate cytidylyltransferase (CMP-KDO synthetase)
VEHNGKNPQQLVVAIIPARYSSTRLPGKMLLPINGKPLILHTLDQALLTSNVDRVIVATDDTRIFDVVVASGNEAVMTSPDHQSGSDRLAEVARDLPEGSIVVNVQGDEPLVSPETIERAVQAMLAGSTTSSAETAAIQGGEFPDIVTVSESITSHDDELVNFNVVKVVTNEEGRALYFSRSPMPFPRDASNRHGGPREALEAEPELFSIFRKHTGLYVYRREYLLKFTAMPQTKLEKIEMLEQLRALENGAYIKVVEAASKSVGVDTKDDLERVRQIIEAEGVTGPIG